MGYACVIQVEIDGSGLRPDGFRGSPRPPHIDHPIGRPEWNRKARRGTPKLVNLGRKPGSTDTE